jgi:hypothetical protein
MLGGIMDASYARAGTVRRILFLLLVAASFGLWAGPSVAGSPSGTAAVAQECTSFVSKGTSPTGGGLAITLPVTLDQLTDESSHVVAGTVRGFQSCLDPASGSIVTRVVLVSTDFLKASGEPRSTGAEVTIEVLGGEVGDIGMRAGTSPEFTVGERVVAFLKQSGGALHLSEGRQSKLSLTAAGLVKPLNLQLTELEAKVHQAAQGALPLEDDPLAGQGELPPQEYSTLAEWAPSDMPVPYYVNPNANRPSQLTAQDSRLAVIREFVEWQNVTSAYLTFRYGGDTTRTSDTFNCNSTNDVTWGIADPAHGSSTLAVTYMCYNPSSGYFTDTDIEIDTDHFGSWWTVDPYDVEVDLPTVMLHEEGHFLGLGHSNPTGGNCPVMKPSYTWGSVQRTPCSDDIAGVRYLYPEGAGSKPATPTGLSASPASPTSVNVSWQNVANEYGYEVWRANKSCATAAPSDFALVDSVDADVTAYLDNWYGQGLPSGVYCYKVRAFNLNGESAFSNQDDTGQPDSDGDTIPDDIDPDDDNDGWTDDDENYVGTNPLNACPDTATANDEDPDPWPPDFDDNTLVDVTDAQIFLAHFPSQPGSPNWSVRFDLTPDGVVDIVDAALFLNSFPDSCPGP